MPKHKHFKVRRRGDVTELCLANTKFYNAEDYAGLRAELDAFAVECKPDKLLVRFDQVDYCSTAVMNALLHIQELLAADGGQVKFSDMKENVREAFKMLSLDSTVFEIHENRFAAAAAF